MNRLPLVSVLIPCHNAARWIGATLQSVLAQTWPRIEVIVVDDGSSDDSMEAMRAFRASNVQIIRQEHGGAATARNRALEKARGRYIQYVDADDLLSPDKIEQQVQLLESEPPDLLAVSGTIHFNDGATPADGVCHDGWPLVDTDDPVEWLIDLLGGDGEGGMVHPGAWLMPCAIARRIGPWNSMMGPDDDGEYFARAVLAARGIRRSAGWSYYRKFPGGGSLSSSSSREGHEGALHAAQRKAELLLARADTPRTRRALVQQYMHRALLSYPDYPDISRAAEEKALQLGTRRFRACFGSRKGRLLNAMFGWKATRRLQRWLRSTRPRDAAGGAVAPSAPAK